jgi:hypothetical protein
MVKFFRTEESRIWLVYLATGIVMFITSLMNAQETAPYMVPIVISGTVIGIILILACMAYLQKTNKEKPEIQDERSAMCSLKATRNAFLIALVFLAIYMIFGQMGAPLVKISALQSVWGISVAAYTVSYFYYKRSF